MNKYVTTLYSCGISRQSCTDPREPYELRQQILLRTDDSRVCACCEECRKDVTRLVRDERWRGARCNVTQGTRSWLPELRQLNHTLTTDTSFLYFKMLLLLGEKKRLPYILVLFYPISYYIENKEKMWKKRKIVHLKCAFSSSEYLTCFIFL